MGSDVAPVKYPLPCGCHGPKRVSMCDQHLEESIENQRRQLGMTAAEDRRRFSAMITRAYAISEVARELLGQALEEHDQREGRVHEHETHWAVLARNLIEESQQRETTNG